MDQTYFNTTEDIRKPSRHLSLEERSMIQALKLQGYSLRKIAAVIGFAHTTIMYELRRGTPEAKSNQGRKPQYTAKRGQKAYNEHRRNSRRFYKIDRDNCEPFIQWMADLNIADELNQRPRRSLGYHAPIEIFDDILDGIYAIEKNFDQKCSI